MNSAASGGGEFHKSQALAMTVTLQSPANRQLINR